MKTNINNASLEELVAIKHIGLQLATRIVENRPYSTLDDFTKIINLGEVRMQEVLEVIYIDTEIVNDTVIDNISEKKQEQEFTPAPVNFMQAIRL